MTEFSATGTDRFCPTCKRGLIKFDDDGSLHVSNMVKFITETTFGMHGPEEILVTEVTCLHCKGGGIVRHIPIP